MNEIWKEIPGTDYSVSDEGRVSSQRKGGMRILKPQLRRGYPSVYVYGGDERKRRPVHHLVAESFLPPKPSPAHQINHKNGITTDNRAENLEWVTQSQNARHRFDVLKHGNPVGEAHGCAKLTEAQVREIRARRKDGETCRLVAARYGVGQMCVSRISRGKSWAYLPAEAA